MIHSYLPASLSQRGTLYGNIHVRLNEMLELTASLQ